MDDPMTPQPPAARAESAEAEVARLQAVVNQGAAGAVCPDLRTHGERVHRIVAAAESAEAAHEAEKAAHERLRARVEALADEWAEDYPGPDAACNRTPDEWATDLRKILAVAAYEEVALPLEGDTDG